MEVKTKRSLEISASGRTCGLVITAFFLVMTLLIPVCVKSFNADGINSPRFYPYLICITVDILSVLFCILYRKETYTFDLGIWPMVACCVLFYLCIKVIGFIAASGVISLILSRCWKVKSWKTTIFLAVVTPLFIYLFFGLLLKVSLPRGILFS